MLVLVGMNILKLSCQNSKWIANFVNYTRQQMFVYLIFLVFLDVVWVVEAEFGVSFCLMSTLLKIFAKIFFRRILPYWLWINPWLINYTGIQDFWGLEACNGFGSFGGRWVQKLHPFLSIWSGLAARVLQFFAKYWKTSPKVSKVISHHF